MDVERTGNRANGLAAEENNKDTCTEDGQVAEKMENAYRKDKGCRLETYTTHIGNTAKA